jgi:DNA-binding GntR family transcriptional regulator
MRLHRVFLDLSGNEELRSYIGTLKLRVFGFALGRYRSRFKEAIVAEHDVFLGLLRQGEKEAAAAYLQHTHWVFNYPDNFIRSQPDSSERTGCRHG